HRPPRLLRGDGGAVHGGAQAADREPGDAARPGGVTPGEVAEVLEASGDTYASLLRSLPAGAATWRPASGEWCVNAVVGHIVEPEKRGFAGRVRLILGEHEPTFETWDQPAVAAARRDCDKSSGDLLAEFEPLRRDSVKLVRSLNADQLALGGHHPKVG